MDTADKLAYSNKSKREAERTELDKLKVVAGKKFRIWPNALMWGVQAGLWMAAFSLILQLAGGGENIALGFLKYIFLIAILGWGLNKYRKRNVTSTFFQQGAYLGALTTAISAVVLLIAGLVVALVDTDLAFSKFNEDIESVNSFFIVYAGTFIEVLVFGMIGTFIWLQYLKHKVDPDAVKK